MEADISPSTVCTGFGRLRLLARMLVMVIVVWVVSGVFSGAVHEFLCYVRYDYFILYISTIYCESFGCLSG